MSCDLPQVPEYLHYNKDKQKIYNPKSFKFFHLLYITGFYENVNPIQFPFTSTSISSCWSKLIKYNDVLRTVLAHNPNLGDHVFYGKIRSIKNFKIVKNCDSGRFAGIHKLETLVIHNPVTCNYSHSEILIKHTYFDNLEIKTHVIKHEEWKKCVLKKGVPKEFFGDLDLKYRAAIATILNNDLNNPNIPFYFTFLPKRLITRWMLWFNLNRFL
jgi:hypothetical protein